MLFIRPEELKRGMRLARPVYNDKGVLLYDINTKLTRQRLQGIKNFGLIGVYVLEPAEPAPVLSADDMEFERFQAVAVADLRKYMADLTEGNGVKSIRKLADDIIAGYGKTNGRINFLKSLRSPQDRIYKHSISVALLCAVMSVNMDMPYMEQINVVSAALIHEVGMTMVPAKILQKGSELSDEDAYTINRCEIEGNELIQNDYNIPSITRIIVSQNFKLMSGKNSEDMKLLDGTKVLRVADVFDTLTAMNTDVEPYSDVIAVKYLLSGKEMYDKKAVGALLKGINILNPGVCVELSNGEKGLVISENKEDILKPVVLSFRHNRVYDLENEKNSGVAINDVMKSMDERVKFSTD